MTIDQLIIELQKQSMAGNGALPVAHFVERQGYGEDQEIFEVALRISDDFKPPRRVAVLN
jgi:hypothetical protein